MTVYLIVGLPGAGKTTRARELEASSPALRLTPDDWQMAVFDDDSPTRWRSEERAGQRFRMEGKMVEVGMRAAQFGIDVVLDFGFWSEDERSALRWIAHALGLDAQVVYLPIEFDEQRRRVGGRYQAEPRQFQMSDEELRQWHDVFQPPTRQELLGGPIPEVPRGHATWSHWASTFWPSLPDLALLQIPSSGPPAAP